MHIANFDIHAISTTGSKISSQPVSEDLLTFKSSRPEIDMERLVNKVAGQPHFKFPVIIFGIRTTGLVDSGANDNFISSTLVRLLACPKHFLKTPSTALVGDGSPLVANSFVRVRVSI